MEMEENNFITLIDENGEEVVFDLLMTFDYEGKKYTALLPTEDSENIAHDEVILLEIVKEEGNEKYVPIENPILLDEVFEEFQTLFDAQFEEEE